jgi:hypothetical protein
MARTGFISLDTLLKRLHAAGWRWQLLNYGNSWMAMVMRGQQGGAARCDHPEEAFLSALRAAYMRAEHSLPDEPPARRP